MARKLPPVDIVIVGAGWTGGILAKELAASGLKIAMLERGGARNPRDDFALPYVRDELRFAQRTETMMDVSKDTYTIRNNPAEEALPMRRLGSFLPGDGMGGAGMHWNGVTWRWPDHELRIRTRYEERYGKAYIPEDMPLQDWGVTGPELEPYYEKFEYTAAVSGKAGNLKGKIQPGGNPFEDSRQRDYPNPALEPALTNKLFAAAAAGLGYHPFQRPTANASRPYTNPDGMRFGQCQYCGFCERFGCESNAKASPNITVLPVALAKPNVELRVHCWVTKVLKDSEGRKATGVAYINTLTGEEIEQPADLVILGAYVLSNVHLLLLSKIGKPYDQRTGKGVVGKNYAYQGGAGVQMFFEGKAFNPFIATGGLAAVIDDFHANWDFDRSEHGYVGGSTIACGSMNGRPVGYHPTPPGSPQWGSDWKRAMAKGYQTAVSVASAGAVMPNRNNYLDLDPTYRNRLGQPLIRMTFDFHANEQKMNRHAGEVCAQIAKAMNPTVLTPPSAVTSWSVVPYQSTHNTGGAVMGTDPATSVVNRFQQCWDMSNLFVVGASAFPHNSAYNPTGPVGAMAYLTADAIRTRYLKVAGDAGLTVLYIDADACPVKDEVYRVAERYALEVFVVSNSWIRTPKDARITSVVVEQGPDLADDWIAERAGPADVVITADIPLAQRALQAGAQALHPAGRPFTADNIGSSLASRAVGEHLRSMGEITGGPKAFAPADRSRFLQALDTAVVKARRR